METWYFIFHSGLWMSLQVDAGSHATARPLPLIGLTATNCGRWTNERNIGRFHGNCHHGPRCPVLLLAVKITCDYLVCFLLQFNRDNFDQAEVHGSVCGLEEFWDLKFSPSHRSRSSSFTFPAHGNITLALLLKALSTSQSTSFTCPVWVCNKLRIETQHHNHKIPTCSQKVFTIESWIVLANKIHSSHKISRERCRKNLKQHKCSKCLRVAGGSRGARSLSVPRTGCNFASWFSFRLRQTNSSLS